MYQVTHFEKSLFIENNKPYGLIKIYFGSKKRVKNTGRIKLEKFLSLCHILENDIVGYDPDHNIFRTNIEASKFVKAPKGNIV